MRPHGRVRWGGRCGAAQVFLGFERSLPRGFLPTGRVRERVRAGLQLTGGITEYTYPSEKFQYPYRLGRPHTTNEPGNESHFGEDCNLGIRWPRPGNSRLLVGLYSLHYSLAALCSYLIVDRL